MRSGLVDLVYALWRMRHRNRIGREEKYERERQRLAKITREHQARRSAPTKPAVPVNVRAPVITKPFAAEMAKMLMAGIPVDQALTYIDSDYPLLKDKQREKCRKAWMNSPLLLEANSALIGGVWQDLDKDRRLQLAVDKHLAELAYLLYSKSYITAGGIDERKMDQARSALIDWLSDKTGDPDSPWMRVLKDLVDGKVGAQQIAGGQTVILPPTLERQ